MLSVLPSWLSVVTIDVDRFEQINDTCGHDLGNSVLQRIAHTCKQALRDSDIAARYDGEEFVLILLDTGALGAATTVERIRCAIAELRLECNGQEIPISASFGVAERAPEDN